ncbi:MAG: hypothetical protein OEV35_07975 [Gallionellaceae bacterium]|nr:hypothetical protein [Gallionellaceae bacterium]
MAIIINQEQSNAPNKAGFPVFFAGAPALPGKIRLFTLQTIIDPRKTRKAPAN